MNDSRPPGSDSDLFPLTRRRFIGGTAGSIAALPLPAMAQSTPETDQPVESASGEITIDLSILSAVSLALVGGGTLADDALQTLGQLISGDPALVTAFEELGSLDGLSARDALDSVSRDAQKLAEEIVGFWYLGNFNGKPVDNRADLYLGLPVWGTLPYITQPTLCKAFGYWATDVTLD